MEATQSNTTSKVIAFPALPASVQAAKEAQQAERAEVTRRTGLVFDADGRVLLPYEEVCPQCGVIAVGRTAGEAVNIVTMHVAWEHCAPKGAA